MANTEYHCEIAHCLNGTSKEAIRRGENLHLEVNPAQLFSGFSILAPLVSIHHEREPRTYCTFTYNA